MDEIGAQLHDGPESAHGNRVRLARLWRESGMDEAAFRAAMAEAVRRTQGASARIRQRANSVDAFPGARNKVPYFLAVLESLLKEPGGSAPRSPVAAPAQRPAPAPTVTGPGHAELWQAVGAALQRRLRTNEWETWLSDGRVVAIYGDELVVALPTALAVEWATRKWGALADAAAAEAAGRPLRVRFVVENGASPEG